MEDARLYGLIRDELRYVRDPQEVYGSGFPGEMFQTLKRNEMKIYVGVTPSDKRVGIGEMGEKVMSEAK